MSITKLEVFLILFPHCRNKQGVSETSVQFSYDYLEKVWVNRAKCKKGLMKNA
jgi:hypothetical protein